MFPITTTNYSFHTHTHTHSRSNPFTSGTLHLSSLGRGGSHSGMFSPLIYLIVWKVVIQTSSALPERDGESEVYDIISQKIISSFLVEVSCSLESLWWGCHSLPHSEVFFYCPCQLAAQGYCQLSVSALIFVSYGQVLLVICYLFSFVQSEQYLSTN